MVCCTLLHHHVGTNRPIWGPLEVKTGKTNQNHETACHDFPKKFRMPTYRVGGISEFKTNPVSTWIYPLVMTNIAIENGDL